MARYAARRLAIAVCLPMTAACGSTGDAGDAGTAMQGDDAGSPTLDAADGTSSADGTSGTDSAAASDDAATPDGAAAFDGAAPQDSAPGAEGASDSTTPRVLNPPNTYVQLFKWRWKDIATECEAFLGPNGFGAVQISPPQESIATNAWWNMYQPVNYQNLVSDMGTSAELGDMIARCHAAGVRVYVDAVLNHAATGAGTGGGGSSYDETTLQYPLFGPDNFHANCTIQPTDYSDNRSNVVNCRLLGLPDLATDTDAVRTTNGAYLASLLGMGADGFRLDAAKHMWPADVQAILAKAPSTTLLGEPVFVTQEVVPDGTVHTSDYFGTGTVNEFAFTYAIRDAFRGNGADISQLPAMVGTGDGGGSRGLDPSADVAVFVDNHDTERSQTDSLNLYQDGKHFDLAMIYLLAQPYGRAQLQSGFLFSFANTDLNAPSASPYDANGSAQIGVAWDFVHRWADVYPMVAFRNATAGLPMTNVQTARANTLAFGRGGVGFVALNNDVSPWQGTLQTGLPAGTYCNIVHGLLAASGSTCASDSVTVDGQGQATVDVGAVGGTTAPAVAIYTGQSVR